MTRPLFTLISKMANDERNFRSIYYEKVGFRSCEEKKSLEILLKDKPFDRQKLKQFSLRFTVPSGYRTLLWKLLLNVTPRYSESFEFVWKQRVETYDDLSRSLKVLQLITNTTPKSNVLVLMYLLEKGDMKYDINAQLDEPVFKGLLSISDSLLEVVEDDVERYWLGRGLFAIVFGFKDTIVRLNESFRFVLEKEDSELHTHLSNLNAFDNQAIDSWFYSLFSNVLHESAIVKIWDKLIGGSTKILIFVAVLMMMTLRRTLLVATKKETAFAEFSSINDETSEVISNKAIELWQKYGSPLHLGDSRKDDR